MNATFDTLNSSNFENNSSKQNSQVLLNTNTDTDTDLDFGLCFEYNYCGCWYSYWQ